MTPILLIVGFLGGGKTTLLRRIAERHAGRRLAFLINEFSAADVDGALVRATATAPALTLPGGSIFCRCLVTEFIETLRALRARIAGEGIEGVVIEASGMADPRAMTTMLRETGLDRDYRLAQVVAVLDPARFLKLRHTLPNIVAQIEAADRVILNKLDVCAPEQRAAAEAAVRELRPDAILLPAVQCAVDFELFRDAARDRAGGAYAPCRDPHYETLAFDPGVAPDFARLARAIAEMREDIYRAKGLVRGATGAVELWEDAGRGLVAEPAPAGAAPTPFVVICRGGAAARVRAALERPLRAETPE